MNPHRVEPDVRKIKRSPRAPGCQDQIDHKPFRHQADRWPQLSPLQDPALGVACAVFLEWAPEVNAAFELDDSTHGRINQRGV